MTTPNQAIKAVYDVPAPAKLNLFLHITGRRDDGYHLLQSVFMLIDWCDTLHVERRDARLRHARRIRMERLFYFELGFLKLLCIF